MGGVMRGYRKVVQTGENSVNFYPRLLRLPTWRTAPTWRTVNTKTSTFSYARHHPNIYAMEAALESLKSLKPGEKPNYMQVAKKYSVEHLMLSRRHYRVQGSYTEKVDISRLLNAI